MMVPTGDFRKSVSQLTPLPTTTSPAKPTSTVRREKRRLGGAFLWKGAAVWSVAGAGTEALSCAKRAGGSGSLKRRFAGSVGGSGKTKVELEPGDSSDLHACSRAFAKS